MTHGGKDDALVELHESAEELWSFVESSWDSDDRKWVVSEIEKRGLRLAAALRDTDDLSKKSQRNCSNCKNSIIIESGYSNYTVTGKEVYCRLDLNPACPFDKWYDESKEGRMARSCERYVEGESWFELDVEHENWDRLDIVQQEWLSAHGMRWWR